MITFRHLVTSALPYVNNELHLGHLAGCLLPADVYSRFLKNKGEDCVYVCGSDEYGTPIALEAEKQGITPKQLSDRYHKIQKESLEKFGLQFDIFSRTSSPEHTKLVQDFYHKLKQNNYIYKKSLKQLYCKQCNRFLPDRYVEGECPHCRGVARGDQCEACGRLVEPEDIKGPHCIICRSIPKLRETEHVFFELSKTAEKLNTWIKGNKHWFPNARNFALQWIKQGLEDRCISRDLEWGVPIPDLQGKVFYVWFDAPQGYITFTKQINRENWWKDANTRLTHFLGKDNIAFHAIFFPGMLIAAGDYILPHHIASYEFLNYEGKKFSKSQRVGVFLRDALKLYPADYWRYMLISTLPERHDSEFTWEEFAGKINNDLNDALGNFAHRTLVFTKNFFDGKIPKPENYTPEDERVLQELKNAHGKITKLLEDIKLKEALGEVIALARLGNQYLASEEPWKHAERQPNVIHVCLRICADLSIYLDPFVPETAKKIRKTLQIPNASWNNALAELEPGRDIGEVAPLFKKIEDKEVAGHKKEFAGTATAKPVTAKKGGKPMINYMDFEKLELKVGVVETAERVKGTDKLIKMSVDTGEKRTLVAGIGDQYEPDQLIGKRIIVLTNLESKTFKGIKSDGMLLAAEEGKSISILSPDKELKPGSKVS